MKLWRRQTFLAEEQKEGPLQLSVRSEQSQCENSKWSPPKATDCPLALCLQMDFIMQLAIIHCFAQVSPSQPSRKLE